VTAALWYQVRASIAFVLGVAAVVGVFSAIELWSNLYHDPFLPNVREQGWTVLRFNLYGAMFIASAGSLVCFFASAPLARKAAVASRRTMLIFALLGAVSYLLLHHSRHVLWYWESGGTW
jgi:hypothetical protein